MKRILGLSLLICMLMTTVCFANDFSYNDGEASIDVSENEWYIFNKEYQTKNGLKDLGFEQDDIDSLLDDGYTFMFLYHKTENINCVIQTIKGAYPRDYSHYSDNEIIENIMDVSSQYLEGETILDKKVVENEGYKYFALVTKPESGNNTKIRYTTAVKGTEYTFTFTKFNSSEFTEADQALLEREAVFKLSFSNPPITAEEYQSSGIIGIAMFCVVLLLSILSIVWIIKLRKKGLVVNVELPQTAAIIILGFLQFITYCGGFEARNSINTTIGNSGLYSVLYYLCGVLIGVLFYISTILFPSVLIRKRKGSAVNGAAIIAIIFMTLSTFVSIFMLAKLEGAFSFGIPIICAILGTTIMNGNNVPIVNNETGDNISANSNIKSKGNKKPIFNKSLGSKKDNSIKEFVDIYAEMHKTLYDDAQFLSDSDYGIVPSKPIMTANIIQSERNLNVINSKTGIDFKWNRIGSVYAPNIDQPIDWYRGSYNKLQVNVYICAYGKDSHFVVPKDIALKCESFLTKPQDNHNSISSIEIADDSNSEATTDTMTPLTENSDMEKALSRTVSGVEDSTKSDDSTSIVTSHELENPNEKPTNHNTDIANTEIQKDNVKSLPGYIPGPHLIKNVDEESIEEQLKAAKDLYEKGLISDSEYTKIKGRIINI